MKAISSRTAAHNVVGRAARLRAEQGYTLLELGVVLGVVAVISAISVPMIGAALGGFRLSGDAHSLTNEVTLTKMRAAANFARERLFVDLTTNGYHMETWNAAANAWVVEGGTVTLSTSDTFSFGVVGAPPPNTQPAISEAQPCLNTATPAQPIANTACVVFNSRGVPVDPVNFNPWGGYALYVTDGTAVWGSTISATGSIRQWRTAPTVVPAWNLQ